jgi:hypothetical protein
MDVYEISYLASPPAAIVPLLPGWAIATLAPLLAATGAHVWNARNLS